MICTYSELSGSMLHVHPFLHHVFLGEKMPLYGLQACIGNYQKITNTNAAANNPPIYKNKGRHYFCDAIKISLFSQKNKDKYNEVTLRLSQYNLGLAFHTAYSCIFHPCYLLPHFPLLHFPPLQFCPYRIFHSRIFSRPAKTFGDTSANARTVRGS